MADKKEIPRICEHCSHWFQHRIYTPADEHGKRKLDRLLPTGACERFKSNMIEVEGKLDEIQCPMPVPQILGDATSRPIGGYVCTGKDFGCNEFRAKAEEKNGWTNDGEAKEPKGRCQTNDNHNDH